jgi:hypothetical protein
MLLICPGNSGERSEVDSVPWERHSHNSNDYNLSPKNVGNLCEIKVEEKLYEYFSPSLPPLPERIMGPLLFLCPSGLTWPQCFRLKEKGHCEDDRFYEPPQ